MQECSSPPDARDCPRPPQAYVRPVREAGMTVYAIHDEAGQPLGVAPTRALAHATIRQHDLAPADAH